MKTGKKKRKKTKLEEVGTEIPYLSACLMVKDEEVNLPRCLTSIKDFVDEIIVVDTGSTDKTVEIAESFGAKIYHHPWEDDFSKHRNLTVSYATGELIFVIDADEELVLEKDVSSIRKSLKKDIAKYPAGAVLIKDIQKNEVAMQFTSARLFKNGKVTYYGIVHNQPTISGHAIYIPYMHIRHYGYDFPTPEAKAKKFTRTVSLLNKRLEECPSDYNTYFYLCQMYADAQDSQKCVSYGEKYLEHRKDLEGGGNFNKSIFFTVIHNYMKIGDTLKSKEWLDMAWEALPMDLDISLVYTEYGVWINDPEKTVMGAKRFIQAYQKSESEPGMRENRFVYSQKPEALAYCVFYLCTTQLKEGSMALQLLGNVLKETPEPFRKGIMEELDKELKSANLPIHLQQSGTVGSSKQSTGLPIVGSPGDPTDILQASMNTIMGGRS